ncbi:MAG: DUF4197 domain-containing protein [Erythrobacter sp.]
MSLSIVLSPVANAGQMGGMQRGKKAAGGGLSALLGRATDGALDKLSQPGAFFADKDVRIGLPIVGNVGGLLGTVIGAGSQLGLLDGLTRGINDAAGVAAGEAKPIFRDAISNLSFKDAPAIIRQDDGATQYLRQSSNDRLQTRLRPLVDGALERAGIFREFDNLSQKHAVIRETGLNREKISQSVTDQGLKGIFNYIGREERAFRANPVGGLGNLLGK